MKLLSLLLLVLTIVGCSSQTTHDRYQTAQDINVLVMGDDADTDTIARSSSVFNRVLNGLNDELGDYGYQVYDESAVTSDHFTQGRSRRSNAELLDIAQSIQRPPMDVVAIFSIYADVRNKGYTNKVAVRIEGRLVGVQSGRQLGQFEVDGPLVSVSPNCSSACMREAVGDHASQLSSDLGAVLAEKLGQYLDDSSGQQGNTAYSHSNNQNGYTSAYDVVLDGFSASEVQTIESHLEGMEGYVEHRFSYNSHRRAELWYKTTLKSATLNREVRNVLDTLDLHSRVQFSGNQLTIQKIGLRGKVKAEDSSYQW